MPPPGEPLEAASERSHASEIDPPIAVAATDETAATPLSPADEAKIKNQLLAWARQSDNRLLQAAAESALTVVDPTKATLRRAVPVALSRRLANEANDITLYNFRDSGDAEFLGDVVLDPGSEATTVHGYGEVGALAERLSDCVLSN